MQCDDLLGALNAFLKPELFKDYAPNGLQVQGKSEIKKIVTAVSATQTVIDRAVELQADALLVHHGWFWKGENPCIVRTKHRRLKTLLSADINLIGYHLPLDAHPEIGNNALLGKLLNAQNCMQTSEGNFLWMGEIAPKTLEQLTQYLSEQLSREVLVLGNRTGDITRVAWCSGSGKFL